MKKTVPFEIFGPNQYLMFDIMGLAELERVAGKTVLEIITEQQIGVDFVVKALPIAMKKQFHLATPEFFAEKIEQFFENGGSFDQIGVPLARAIMITGILGSEVRDRVIKQMEKIAGEPEEKNAEGTNSPSRHSKAGATGRKQ